MYSSFLPFVLVRQGRYIKDLIKQGAVDPTSAISFEDAGIPKNLFVEKLMKQGVIVETTKHELYANIEELSRNPIWRRYIKKYQPKIEP